MTAPDRDGEIFVGKGEHDEFLSLALANRHGLVTGATGTGKTVTLQVLAEGLSRAGVAVFAADIKGDLSGIAARGEAKPAFVKRASDLGFTYAPDQFPAVFWDLFGEQGHPIRATVFEMGPLLVSRMLNLNDVQEGIINIAFRYADDDPELKAAGGSGLIDLKDLRELLSYLSKNSKEISARYGNVAVTAVGAVQRQLLVLENQGGTKFFGAPQLDIDDLIRTDPMSGRGIINILAADKLMSSPKLYATFLLWLLSELFGKLPEVGDPPKPKLCFFFDEAHLLFNEAPKELLEKVEQVVRLIRSKGVGVYFVTQNPADVPDKVLAQLGNRVQHALRAFTPADQKAVKAAADTFRPNPKLNTAQVITQLGKGEALVSFLEGAGTPAMVDRTIIRPPSARIGPVSDDERKAIIAKSPFKGKYDTAVDPNSAFEILQKRLAEGGGLPAPGEGVPGAPGEAASTNVGFFHRITLWFKNLFGIGRPHGQTLTTSQAIARNVARAVVAGVATQVASEISKSAGGRTAGNIGKAVVRGALGGVLRR
ncbi:MAG TPA: helicase HerA-like domain-containing protein [Xanthobacteraceae bacterium]|jgi:DNA helicase HerA-like ATPase|nr:helicase HerA-like domain-containing protein [Xanthobacteraceae bacterium]